MTSYADELTAGTPRHPSYCRIKSGVMRDGTLVARDVFMGVVILLLKRVGQTGLPVHFVGKAATFNLLYAFPILLLSTVEGTLGDIARPLGWAFAWWGVALSRWGNPFAPSRPAGALEQGRAAIVKARGGQ